MKIAWDEAKTSSIWRRNKFNQSFSLRWHVFHIHYKRQGIYKGWELKNGSKGYLEPFKALKDPIEGF